MVPSGTNIFSLRHYSGWLGKLGNGLESKRTVTEPPEESGVVVLFCRMLFIK